MKKWCVNNYTVQAIEGTSLYFIILVCKRLIWMLCATHCLVAWNILATKLRPGKETDEVHSNKQCAYYRPPIVWCYCLFSNQIIFTCAWFFKLKPVRVKYATFLNRLTVHNLCYYYTSILFTIILLHIFTHINMLLGSISSTLCNNLYNL